MHVYTHVGFIRNHTLFVIIRGGFVDGEWSRGAGGRGREDFVFSVLYPGEKYTYIEVSIYRRGFGAGNGKNRATILDLPLIIHTTTTTFLSELSYSSTVSFHPKAKRAAL